MANGSRRHRLVREYGKAEVMVGLFESLGVAEILLILAVVLLLFGAKKLPEMARSLGRSSNEFKRGLREGHVEGEEPASEPTEKTRASEERAE
jgi:sec-independent protein translocase protein TatA